ncbi:hypothetical protein SDC9_211306 [bioreactor metagenome]|uniref:Uncharacterized protein n=1 Tax=bioreactor metagenome TaxID=1076179 RepID=A0A645JJX4_9ZZZZ
MLITFRNIHTVIEHLAVRWLQQLQNGSSQCALAAAGFSNDTQRTAFLNRQIHIVHSMKPRGFAYLEIFLKAYGLQQWNLLLIFHQSFSPFAASFANK